MNKNPISYLIKTLYIVKSLLEKNCIQVLENIRLYIRAYGFIIVRSFYFIRAFCDILFIISLKEEERGIDKESAGCFSLIAIVVQANPKRAKKGKRCRQRSEHFLRGGDASLWNTDSVADRKKEKIVRERTSFNLQK